MKSGSDVKSKTKIRPKKYADLKEFWEKLNRKVVLEYKFDKGISLGELFGEYLIENKDKFHETGARTKVFTVTVADGIVNTIESSEDSKFQPIKMMTYQAFLNGLSKAVALNVSTLHDAFSALKAKGFNVNQFLSNQQLDV